MARKRKLGPIPARKATKREWGLNTLVTRESDAAESFRVDCGWSICGRLKPACFATGERTMSHEVRLQHDIRHRSFDRRDDEILH